MPPLSLDAQDAAGLAWCQRMVTEHHYLHAPVDPRCRPLAYIVHHQASWGAAAAAGPRAIGILIFGRPEATRCYQGGLTYGSQADVAAGRAQFDRWEVLNLARVWFHPRFQAGGLYCSADDGLPGYTDRRGVWRSTLASTAISWALARINADYLTARPPVFVEEPYAIRAVLSYCDTRQHRGTIYRAAGFRLGRTNEDGIETWWTDAVTPLTQAQDTHIRSLAAKSPRSIAKRAQRGAGATQEAFPL